MEKYIYDNSNGPWFELHGDYYIPCLVLQDTEERSIGIWGRKHLNYIISRAVVSCSADFPFYSSAIFFSVTSAHTILTTKLASFIHLEII